MVQFGYTGKDERLSLMSQVPATLIHSITPPGAIYQVSLSTYFLLVIRYSFQELRLRKLSKWFHLPFLVGLTLACAGLPLYQ